MAFELCQQTSWVQRTYSSHLTLCLLHVICEVAQELRLCAASMEPLSRQNARSGLDASLSVCPRAKETIRDLDCSYKLELAR